MNVSPQEPFKIVYALFEHQFLGYLFESFAVQLNDKNKMTLRYQNISAKNANEFDAGLNETDYELIELMDSMQQDVVLHKFSPKKLNLSDFFFKVYNPEDGDKILQEKIAVYLEEKRAAVLERLKGKLLFEMANDGNPTYRRIRVESRRASIWFHFKRNERNTLYYPTMKLRDEKIDFQDKNAFLLCHKPAWLVSEQTLYGFENNLEGSKIKPFLSRRNILINRTIEDTYFRKFVAPLVEQFPVIAEGFTIKNYDFEPASELIFSEEIEGSEELFAGKTVQESGSLIFNLRFDYGGFVVDASEKKAHSVKVEKIEDEYIFHRLSRRADFEDQQKKYLAEMGFPVKTGKGKINKYEGFELLSRHREDLEKAGLKITQSTQNTKRYFLGKSEIDLQIKENYDWFDVHCKVTFGEFELPFMRLREMILNNVREFELPNGEIAIIPDAWFVQYADIFGLMESNKDGMSLKKFHLAMLQDLHDGRYAGVTMSRKLEKLRDFEGIDDYEIPEDFVGTLRPYQKAGYNWLRFLSDYHFGGCLADDMGLGKTVQTLALLQARKQAETEQASLLIMPTSLLYNWEMEAAKFTPHLKVLNYTGTNREKDVSKFDDYDLILTSYGIVRIDTELLSDYYFDYIILDESQAIKNPNSNIAKSVKKMNSRYRLILTGTPIENSTLDLWSQISFVNPGLLGNLNYFKKQYQLPIEKNQDTFKTERLHSIIKPFVLRRKKSQVAKDLPEKVENVKYCSMTEAQSEAYEETKSYFRNKILEQIEKTGIGKSQITLLQGLTRLRQIANHPRLSDAEYAGDSGKTGDVTHMLESAVRKEHKILIFSQFVKHLAVFREILDEQKLKYAYLDGSTKDREEQVRKFQESEDVPLFLISMKAGGVGLNLTAADYVFILDPWWNPAVEAQAIDRAHRIGQENKVMIYKFISRNTVEEKILKMQQRKMQLADSLINTEEGFVKSLSRSDIEELLA